MKKSIFETRAVYAAWLIAVIASLISLYYSEIKGIDPCKLCWYQRVFLFPLPLLLFPILWKQKKDLVFYIIILPFLGLLVAIYQFVTRPPCCYDDPINPLFSIAAFLIITILLGINSKRC